MEEQLETLQLNYGKMILDFQLRKKVFSEMQQSYGTVPLFLSKMRSHYTMQKGKFLNFASQYLSKPLFIITNIFTFSHL